MNAKTRITLTVTVPDTITNDFIKPFSLYLVLNGKTIGYCNDRYCRPVQSGHIQITFDIYPDYVSIAEKFEQELSRYGDADWKSKFVVTENVDDAYKNPYKHHNELHIWKE